MRTGVCACKYVLCAQDKWTKHVSFTLEQRNAERAEEVAEVVFVCV